MELTIAIKITGATSSPSQTPEVSTELGPPASGFLSSFEMSEFVTYEMTRGCTVLSNARLCHPDPTFRKRDLRVPELLPCLIGK